MIKDFFICQEEVVKYINSTTRVTHVLNKKTDCAKTNMIGYFENRNEIELKFASREKKAPVNKGVNFHIRIFKFTFLSI